VLAVAGVRRVGAREIGQGVVELLVRAGTLRSAGVYAAPFECPPPRNAARRGVGGRARHHRGVVGGRTRRPARRARRAPSPTRPALPPGWSGWDRMRLRAPRPPAAE